MTRNASGPAHSHGARDRVSTQLEQRPNLIFSVSPTLLSQPLTTIIPTATLSSAPSGLQSTGTTTNNISQGPNLPQHFLLPSNFPPLLFHNLGPPQRQENINRSVVRQRRRRSSSSPDPQIHWATVQLSDIALCHLLQKT